MLLNSAFDTKKKLAAIVYSYYITENPKQNLLIIKDSKTGKRIGDYSSSGLDLN